MSWTVEWEPPADREFLSAWVDAPDPAVPRLARDEAIRRLAVDPYTAGRHLAEGLWRADVPPLAVYYTIDPAGRRVVVSNVGHLP
jgi:hypothetical protein